jgi:alpha-tubulin suppressor-like RCC1 family protein
VNAYGQATVPAGLTNAVAIAAGNSDSMALRADGTVIAWGYNGNGATNVPSALTNVVAISAGAYHNLARVGTSPLILATPVAQLARSASSFSLVVPSQSGRVYALEYKDNLSDANWTSLPLTAGTGTDLVLLDPTANDSQRFYRVRRW